MVSKVIKGKDTDNVISGKLIFFMKTHKINRVANTIYKNEYLGDKNTGPFLSTETHHIFNSFPLWQPVTLFFNRNLNMLGY